MTPATAPLGVSSSRAWQARTAAAGDRAHVPLILPLREAGDPAIAGGKASALSRLLQHRVCVPEGFVLACAARDLFLTSAGLAPAIEARLATLHQDDPRSLEEAARAIRACVVATALPAPLELDIRAAAVGLLAQGPVVVRSSAVGEDGAQASFAGQFDSVLHVRDADRLCDAVRECWASCWSARALFYRRCRGIADDGMAVIVQRQVQATAAGVLFTCDPHDDPGAMVLEWVQGLADRLVSGDATPRRAYVSRVTGERLREEGGAGEAPDLTPPQMRQLHATGVQLEAVFGGPQDIEWAFGPDGELSVVQSRPITVLSQSRSAPATGPGLDPHPSPVAGRPPAEPGWGVAADAGVLWSNANINENFPDPVSPLLYSIACDGYRSYFRNLGLAFGVSRRRLDAMEPHFRTIIGAHGARLYYNLTNIHAVLRMAPFGDRLAAAFNLFVGADAVASQPASARAWRDVSRAHQTVELLRIAGAVLWQFLPLPRRLRRFERTADAFADATTHENLDDAGLQRLGSHVLAFMRIRCDRWKDASLCDTAAMVTYAWLRRTLARRGYGDATHTRLLRALPNVPSSMPAIRLWELSRSIAADADLAALIRERTADEALAQIRSDARFAVFRTAFERYLDEWGFRSSGELMLTVPTLEESPAPVLALLRSYLAASSNGPVEAIGTQAEERRLETRRVLTTIARRAPLAAAYLWVLLRLTQGAIACRERARLKQALLYTRLRRVALAIGRALVRDGRLSQVDDVFMLTWHELEEICAGRAMFPYGIDALARLRRTQHAEACRLTPPDTFTRPEGAGWRGEGGPAGRVPLSPPMRAAGGAEAPALRGAIACGGRVTAPAAVLAGVHEADRLSRGDILVTRQTDPGWAPVFPLVSGLVIERGGMLSHGAIIAREFGLPCLVGVRDATVRIPHGTVVTIATELEASDAAGLPPGDIPVSARSAFGVVLVETPS